MKSVLISIHPKWCELIANGKKTVEVRKTKPKIETPFKVYIYCTNSKEVLWILRNNERNSNKIASIFTAKDVGGTTKSNGKVIGEFVCDKIDEYTNYSLDEQYGHINRRENLLRSACMTLKDWRDYIGSYRSDLGYAWHISNLIIYDKPKKLSQLRSYNGRAYYDEELKLPMPTHEITRPPQSWCYVQKRSDNNAE